MLKKIIFLVATICLIFFFSSCVEKRKTPDISNIKVNLKFSRFEQDLFRSDFEKISDSIPFFHKKYGEFFDIFNYKIIRIGDYKNPAYPELLKAFVTDYNTNKIIKTVNNNFSNIDTIKVKITDAFRYFKYYFPAIPVPFIITYISGFNQSIITTDTILGIGLDKYLGPDCDFYYRLGLSHYMVYHMQKTNIPADCINAWTITQFPMSDSADNLLANIIYRGKLIYLSRAVLPEEADTVILGITPGQIDWCKKNEQKMWAYLVENKLLFKTDYLTINKFINDGPYTKDFGRNSPARAAVWLGFQIINDYMKHNPQDSLLSLMKENDYLKILRLSRYKP
jgi:hypothetical protein